MNGLGRAALFVLVLLAAAVAAHAEQPRVSVAVADFDYYDTSGEPRDQAAEHGARMRAFAGILRDSLAGRPGYAVVPLVCAEEACSVEAMGADALLRSAREAGARVLVYGGVHKMSTLVQWGRVQAVDLEREELLLDRSISFRGDSDEAFRRAAEFVLQYLEAATPDP
ncbi:MAG: DUF2380 domain-containing protein [Tistlia sp.]|uniref:DUF2380 domain-containing protein n=1 Tax=Tistlia sp. TaxID=3057121 RepID=UPI0034A5BE2A